jgi:hypothetical protein
MTNGTDVLKMLFPNGGWAIRGDEYEGIDFINIEPITKVEYDKAFAGYDAWKAEQDAKAESDKAALLSKLGITADEAKLLLS